MCLDVESTKLFASDLTTRQQGGSVNRLNPSLRDVAVAAALTLFGAAHADIIATGNTNTYPGNLPIGPGDSDLGNVGLFVGNCEPRLAQRKFPISPRCSRSHSP